MGFGTVVFICSRTGSLRSDSPTAESEPSTLQQTLAVRLGLRRGLISAWSFKVLSHN